MEIKYLVFLMTLCIMEVSICRTETYVNSSCVYHPYYCFYFKDIGSLSTLNQVQTECSSSFPGSWPIEIYDETLQNDVNSFIAAYLSTFNQRTIYLNAERITNGWALVQVGPYEQAFFNIDNQNANENKDFVYLDKNKKSFSCDLFNSVKGYICSTDNLTSNPCSSNNTLLISGRCFTAFDEPKNWFEAQNECIKKGQILAIIKQAHVSIQTTDWIQNTQQTQWWIGTMKNPFKWSHKGDLITWSKFESYSGSASSQIAYFLINDDKWSVGNSMATALLCMSENTNSSDITTTKTTTTTTLSKTSSKISTSITVTADNLNSSTLNTNLNLKETLGIGLGVGLSLLVILLVIFMVIWIKKLKRKCCQLPFKTKNKSEEPIIYDVPVRIVPEKQEIKENEIEQIENETKPEGLEYADLSFMEKTLNKT